MTTACCDLHVGGMGKQLADGSVVALCCDPNDCGPCCENCPTCPTLQRRKAAS